MKLSNGNIVLTLIALLAALVSAEQEIFMVVRTLIHFEETLPATELRKIGRAINGMRSELDNVVKDVIVNATIPSLRYLRVGDDRKLPCSSACGHISYYTLCYVSGVWMDRCRRGLTMHEDLAEEKITELNEDDRRRHLQISTLCEEAKEGVASAISNATSEGIIPLPPNSTVVEECYYEILTPW